MIPCNIEYWVSDFRYYMAPKSCNIENGTTMAPNNTADQPRNRNDTCCRGRTGAPLI